VNKTRNDAGFCEHLDVALYCQRLGQASSMKASHSRFAQVIFDLALKAMRAIPVTRQANVLGKRRGPLALLGDPLVIYQLGGMQLLLPLSHNLPIYRQLYPNYSAQAARIARHVHGKYPTLTFIDIGANVGDTVALVRELAHFPILSVEGNDRFFELLQANVAHIQDVYLEHAFVGHVTGTVKGTIALQSGTSYLVEDKAKGTFVQTKTLSDILSTQPIFAHSKMIKLDTDGLDCRILNSELELLSRLKPVILFEYDPYYFVQHGDDGLVTLANLQRIGYRTVLVYENTGEYLLTANLDNGSLLQDLNQFYLGRGGKRYCDICVFHADDADLAQVIRLAEIEFFKSRSTATA
jgi:FkbM family methyltransferase